MQNHAIVRMNYWNDSVRLIDDDQRTGWMIHDNNG